MRIPAGHAFTEGHGEVIEPGDTIEVAAPEGQQFAALGYELVSIRHNRQAGLVALLARAGVLPT